MVPVSKIAVKEKNELTGVNTWNSCWAQRKYLINIGYFKNNLSIHLTNITAGSYSQLGQLLAEA